MCRHYILVIDDSVSDSGNSFDGHPIEIGEVELSGDRMLNNWHIGSVPGCPARLAPHLTTTNVCVC